MKLRLYFSEGTVDLGNEDSTTVHFPHSIELHQIDVTDDYAESFLRVKETDRPKRARLRIEH